MSEPKHLGFREFYLTGRRTIGLLIKENPITVWVRLCGGRIIKRHKDKHGVTTP